MVTSLYADVTVNAFFEDNSSSVELCPGECSRVVFDFNLDSSHTFEIIFEVTVDGNTFPLVVPGFIGGDTLAICLSDDAGMMTTSISAETITLDFPTYGNEVAIFALDTIKNTTNPVTVVVIGAMDSLEFDFTNQIVPALGALGPYCPTDMAVALPTTEDGITGDWSGDGVSGNQFDPALVTPGSTVTLTFTPSPATQCADPNTTDVMVYTPPALTPVEFEDCLFNLQSFDLASRSALVNSNMTDTVKWFNGQPSMGGTRYLPATDVDITEVELWVQVVDVNDCTSEMSVPVTIVYKQATILTNDDSYSGEISPQGGSRYQRHFYLLRQDEIAATELSMNDIINSIGFTLTVAQDAITQGAFKVYLENTTDIISRFDTTWTEVVSMTNSYSAINIPSGDYEWQVQAVCTNDSLTFTGISEFSNADLSGCNRPINLISDSIGDNYVKLSWYAPTSPGLQHYLIEHKALGSTTWTSNTSTSLSYVANGLIADTIYQWRVSTICASGSSDPTGSTFVTLDALGCAAPPAVLPNGAVNDTSIQLSWDSAGGATGYIVESRQIGSSFWFATATNTNSVRLELGLKAGTTYEWRVRAVCAIGTSIYTDGNDFTTSGATVCYTPAELFTNAISSSGAKLNWTGTPGATVYNIRYRLKRSISWDHAKDPMILVHDDTISIPSEIGPYHINFSGVSHDTMKYTGGGLYVAYEYSNSTGPVSSLNSALASAQNTVLKGSFGQDSIKYVMSLITRTDNAASGLDTVLTSVDLRPITHLGSKNLVDSVEVVAVYAMGHHAISYSSPTPISALVKNYADEARTLNVNLVVKDQASGIERWTDTQNVTIPAVSNMRVTFTGWTPELIETDSIIVSVDPLPGENAVRNNTNHYIQKVNASVMAQADGSSSITGAGFGAGSGLLLNRFMMNGCGSVNAAQIFLDFSARNNSLYAVILDATGAILDSSSVFTPDSTEVNAYHAFYFPKASSFTNENFYIGLAQPANAMHPYHPVGVQWESEEVRDGNYYRDDIIGGNLSDNPLPGRLMIRAEIVPGRPVPKIVGNNALCTDSTNILTVESATLRYATRVVNYSSEFSNVGFSVLQALGTPNVYPAHEINTDAWVSNGPTDREYLELEFTEMDSVNFIDIYETFNPGSVDTVYVKDPNTNTFIEVYSASAGQEEFVARILHIDFALTQFKVSEIRIAMSTPDSLGARSIDAVCIGRRESMADFATYLWSPGNETTASISVSATGTYSVIVDAAFACSGSDSVAIFTPIQISPIITADGITTFCPGDSVILTSDRETGNLWSPGMETTQSITVYNPGSYFVTVDDGTGCGLVTSSSMTVSHLDVPTNVVTGNTIICPGESTVLGAADIGGYTYAWSNGATSREITVNTLATFYVTVTNPSGCSSIASATTIAAPDLMPVITGNLMPLINGTLVICPGDTADLDVGSGYASQSWSTGSGAQSVEVLAAGFYSVTVTNAQGCTGDTSVSVSFYTLTPFTIEGSTTFCPDSTTELSVSGFVSYEWSTNSIFPVIDVGIPGPYSVTVTDANGCNGTGVVHVTELTRPFVQIGGDVGYCPGDMATLDAGAGFNTYQWSNGGGTAQTASFGSPGDYSVTITDSKTCGASDTVTIAEFNVKIPFISGTLSFCGGAATQLDAGAGFVAYLWSTGETTRMIDVVTIGTFSVTVTDGNGCTSSSYVETTGEGTVPVSPGPISGPQSGLCNQSITYSISPVSNAEYYVWSVPEGDTILSGQGTTSIEVLFRDASTGEIEVGAANSCGQSPSLTRRFIVVFKTPPPPDPINGPVTPVCANDVITYSINEIPGVTSYQWIVPVTASVTAGQGTAVAEITFGSDYVEGDICVYAVGVCGNGPATCLTTIAGLDSDGDQILDCNDNCPFTYNPHQKDKDGDGIGDLCDPCDNNGGGGGPCDDGDPCTTDDTFDENCNCVGIVSPDSDNDGVCDVEDACPGFDDALDMDGDGVPDDCDICPLGDDNDDGNNNGVPDACDTCSSFIASAGDCEVVFVGWAPEECVDLIASAIGGTAPLAYSWSIGCTDTVTT
ncbi:MAG: hypothetical protein DRI69_04505, partial [Bacteroidetes bacterium]